MGGCKILRDRFLHEHDPVFSVCCCVPSLAFFVIFLDLCPSVRPFCVCVPGRSLSWGISCCLVCIICLCAACASVLFLRAFGVTGAGCTFAPPTEMRAHFPPPLTKVNSGVFLTGCAAASLGYFCESPIAGHSHIASYSSAHQDENHKAATLQWMRLRFSS